MEKGCSFAPAIAAGQIAKFIEIELRDWFLIIGNRLKKYFIFSCLIKNKAGIFAVRF